MQGFQATGEHPALQTMTHFFIFFLILRVIFALLDLDPADKNQRVSTAVYCVVDPECFIPDPDPTLQLTGLGIGKVVSYPVPDETNPRSSGSKGIQIYDTARIISAKRS